MNPEIARAEFAKLPLLNGYAEVFSVKAGEPLRLRVAHKPDTWEAPSTAPQSISPLDSIVAVEIVSPVTMSAEDRIGIDPPVPLYSEVPRSYFGAGAAYRTLLELDTSGFSPGLYEAVVITAGGLRSAEIFFLIRPRWTDHYAKMIFVLPTFTWQAYNRIGGGSLYVLSGELRERVSVKRPVIVKPAATLHSAEAAIPFVRLARFSGIDVTVIDSVDLHNGVLDSAEPRVVVLLGHDEYWTLNMRACIDRLLDRGLFLLVLGGNTCWWRADFDGEEVTVRKRPGELSAQWFRFPQYEPEETTFGASYRFGGYSLSRHYRNPESHISHLLDSFSEDEVRLADGVVVATPDHPIFEGLEIGPDGHFGAQYRLISGEIDGLRFNRQGEVDVEFCPKAPREVTILATTTVAVSAWNPKGGFPVACFLEARIRNGIVLNLSTFGIGRGLLEGYSQIERLASNALRYAYRCAADAQQAQHGQ